MTPVESFKRSIKRDSGHFTNFKEGKYWDASQRNTFSTARAQDVDSVLNPNHAPSTKDDADIFKEKQKFVCSFS